MIFKKRDTSFYLSLSVIFQKSALAPAHGQFGGLETLADLESAGVSVVPRFQMAIRAVAQQSLQTPNKR